MLGSCFQVILVQFSPILRHQVGLHHSPAVCAAPGIGSNTCNILWMSPPWTGRFSTTSYSGFEPRAAAKTLLPLVPENPWTFPTLFSLFVHLTWLFLTFCFIFKPGNGLFYLLWILALCRFFPPFLFSRDFAWLAERCPSACCSLRNVLWPRVSSPPSGPPLQSPEVN